MNTNRYIYIKNWAENDSRIQIVNVGKNIRETLDKVGYPFKSKEHSQKLYEYKKGLRGKGLLKYFNKLEGGFRPCPDKLMYQIEDDFNLNISHFCCYEFKKKPAHNWAKENHKSVVMTGMRKDEGGQRTSIGCVSLTKDNKLQKFHPLLVVSNEWENWYVESRNIKLCDLYYSPYNLLRTGCKGCPFNSELEQDLFMMKTLMPEEYKQCEIIWKPVYDEYRKIGYRLKKKTGFELF